MATTSTTQNSLPSQDPWQGPPPQAAQWSLGDLRSRCHSLLPVINFNTLHQQNLEELEARLIKFKNSSAEEQAKECLHDLLHQYCEAVEDYEKMAVRPVMDMDGRRRDLNSFLKYGIRHDKRNTTPQKEIWPMVGIKIAQEDDSEIARQVGRFGELWMSFFFALAGGVALLAPMLIMVYHPSKTTSIVTTCTFVLGFALALVAQAALAEYVAFQHYTKPDNEFNLLAMKSFGSSSLQPKDILAATAAYAAVLVVFVGTSTPSS